MSGWSGETGDADEFLTPNLSCAANKGGVKFCNAEFEKLIDEARGTPDQKKRIALYEQAQEIFKHERPWITMAHSTVYIPIRNGASVEVSRWRPTAPSDFEGVHYLQMRLRRDTSKSSTPSCRPAPSAVPPSCCTSRSRP